MTDSSPSPSANDRPSGGAAGGDSANANQPLGASQRAPEVQRATDFEPGTVLAGQFRVESVLGRGALATVYAATDVHAREPVAVKVVPTFGESAAALRAILPEYQSVRRLEGGRRHVLHIDRPQACEHSGLDLVLLPMERAERTVRDWLRETKEAPGIEERLEEGLALLRQACRGVAALHQAGIVHLDLKPENLLLMRDPDAGEEAATEAGARAATEAGATDWTLKVADFGLARSLRAGEVLNADVIAEGVGTPHYMAPEQIFAARQKDVGPKADVYSLGVMLFELLDGDRPFDGGAEAVRRKHREVAPPAIEAAATVPQALKDLAQACLRKDPAKRPSVEAVVEGLVPASEAERAAFEQAREVGTMAAWADFLDAYPDGWRASDAEDRVQDLKQEAAVQEWGTEGKQLVEEVGVAIEGIEVDPISDTAAMEAAEEIFSRLEEHISSPPFLTEEAEEDRKSVV